MGVILGALFFILIVWFAFWYGRHFVAKNENITPVEDWVQKAELEAGISQAVEISEPLSEEGNERPERLRAAELEGKGISASAVVGERAELGL